MKTVSSHKDENYLFSAKRQTALSFLVGEIFKIEIDSISNEPPYIRQLRLITVKTLITWTDKIIFLFENICTGATAEPSHQLDPSCSSSESNQHHADAQNMPMLGKQIELVVNVLKNKLCTQDGLQQAYTLLSNLSKINSATRSMIIKHLLCGTRELGLAVCHEIEVLMEEAINFNAANAAPGAQPTTSGNFIEQQSLGMLKVGRFFLNLL